MNLIADQSITINAPTSIVFNYVSNMENFGEWFPEVLNIESNNELLHDQVGKEYLENVKIPLKGNSKIKLVVKEVSVNQKFVTEGQLSPLWPRMEISLSNNNPELCIVNWRMYSRNTNFVIKLFLLPIVKIIMNKRAATGVRNLKVILENKI